MEADKLGDVCPACGLPRSVFETYRERVQLNRLRLLALDTHPITIHFSQVVVILIPVLILLVKTLPEFEPVVLSSVLRFSIFIFPFTLIASAFTGAFDGIIRFKTLNTPLLRTKIIYSIIIVALSFVMFFYSKHDNYGITTILCSLAALLCAVRLGLLGKSLLNVILPGKMNLFKKAKKKKA